jgi:hypothetical protein
MKTLRGQNIRVILYGKTTCRLYINSSKKDTKNSCWIAEVAISSLAIGLDSAMNCFMGVVPCPLFQNIVSQYSLSQSHHVQGLVVRSPLVRFRAAARVSLALMRRFKRKKEKRKKTEKEICTIA